MSAQTITSPFLACPRTNHDDDLEIIIARTLTSCEIAERNHQTRVYTARADDLRRLVEELREVQHHLYPKPPTT